jgi:hypothetical protein
MSNRIIINILWEVREDAALVSQNWVLLKRNIQKTKEFSNENWDIKIKE